MALTKAERMFRVKLAAAIKARDWARVETVFEQYGAYLDLITEEPAEPNDS